MNNKEKAEYLENVAISFAKCSKDIIERVCDNCSAIKYCKKFKFFSKPDCDEWYWYVGEETDNIPLVGFTQLQLDRYTCVMLQSYFTISEMKGKWSKLIYPE